MSEASTTSSTSVNTGLSSARGRDVQGSFAVEDIKLLGSFATSSGSSSMIPMHVYF